MAEIRIDGKSDACSAKIRVRFESSDFLPSCLVAVGEKALLAEVDVALLDENVHMSPLPDDYSVSFRRQVAAGTYALQQHRVAVTVEAVFRRDRVRIGGTHGAVPAERRGEHQ